MMSIESRVFEPHAMSALIKVQNNGQVTIPPRLRSQAGISEGDLVEASFDRGRIVLTPKPIIDRSKFPSAEDEYTPEQRRVIDREIARGLEDIKQGRTYGPFNTVEEMAASIEGNIKKSRRATKRSIGKSAR